ncbi:Dbl homology domain-containing protein, partial [Eremomyces bilateralis CBS 781.70]
SVGSVATVMAPQDSAVDLETQMSAKSKILKDLVERKNILKELCDTEYSYQQDMIILEDIYKSTSTGILNDADRKVLFGNSDQIRLFATKLQDALKQAVSSVYIMPRQNRWNAKRGSFSTSSSATNETSLDSDASLSKDDRIEIDQRTRVGNAFLANMEEIERVYNVYLRNHTAANNKLTELKAEPNVEAWMEECRKMAADLTSAWNLDALLVKPTQRITKYPLILRNLLQVTVKEHPDYADIEKSLLQLEELLHKMNDSKKRAELVDQAMSQNRRRKESDIRLFPQKFVNRRAEKLKQQVGLSNSAIDADYDKLSQRFGGHFFQLQIVMRDVENYIREVQAYVSRYGHFLSASEHFLGFDIQNQHPEEQSHFVIFARTVREVIAVALPEHTAKIRKSVIEPIQTLWQLHENPQQLMRKRKKRVVDYAKWNAMVERGEAPDKKLRDAADQFKAINETLKDELPKLYDLSSKLMKVCLENFIELQKQWQDTWMRKLEPAAREPQITDDYSSDMLALERDYNDNFAYVDERMQTLGVLNGKTLEE